MPTDEPLQGYLQLKVEIVRSGLRAMRSASILMTLGSISGSGGLKNSFHWYLKLGLSKSLRLYFCV
jgi:hypothetical protein